MAPRCGAVYAPQSVRSNRIATAELRNAEPTADGSLALIPGAAGSGLLWDDRFAALDRALAARLHEVRSPDPEVAWVWRQFVASGGRASIAVPREELGWSPKRLIARFREQVGLPPKQAARLPRFEAAALLGPAAPTWSEAAQRRGYADQAHMIHEFRRFAGDTPEGLRRRRMAGGGFAAD